MVQVKPLEEDRRPSAVYLDVIVRGAKENGLPKVSITSIFIITSITVIFIRVTSSIMNRHQQKHHFNLTSFQKFSRFQEYIEKLESIEHNGYHGEVGVTIS